MEDDFSWRLPKRIKNIEEQRIIAKDMFKKHGVNDKLEERLNDNECHVIFQNIIFVLLEAGYKLNEISTGMTHSLASLYLNIPEENMDKQIKILKWNLGKL